MNDSFGKLMEPQPVPFSFGAPGWYVVGGLILIGLIGIGWLIYTHYKRNAYRRRALQHLAGLEKELTANNNLSALLYEHNMMMKRLAMTVFTRQQTASLRGNDWLNLLNQSLGQELFSHDDIRTLHAALYQSASVDEVAAKKFIANTKLWISKHKRYIKHTTRGTGHAL